MAQHEYWLNRHGTHSEITQEEDLFQLMGPEIPTCCNQRPCVLHVTKVKGWSQHQSTLLERLRCKTQRITEPKKKDLITNKTMQVSGYDTLSLTESALCREVLKGSTVERERRSSGKCVFEENARFHQYSTGDLRGC